MKQSKIWEKAVVAFALCVPVLGVTTAQAAETLRMSTAVATSHWLVQDALAQWATDVKKASDGRLQINILSTPVGNAASQFEMARDGVVDIAYANPGLTPGRFELLEVGGLPGMAPDSSTLSIALQRLIEKTPSMQDEFREVQLLGVYVTPPYQLYTRGEVGIKSPEDYHGLKVRVGGGILGEVVESLGAVRVNQPFAKTYEIMSNGIVDGTLSSLDSVRSLGLTRLLSQLTLVPSGFGAAPTIIVMNKKRFEQLDQKDKDALMQASGVNLSEIIGTMFDKRSEDAVADIRAANVKVNIVDEAFTQRLGELLQPVADGWVTQVQKTRNVDGAPILESFRKEIAAVDAAG